MLTLHHVPASRSFRILWLIEELGLEAQIETYSIRTGELHRPGYTAKSPGGRVPALDLPDGTMFESGAIVQHLCETHPQAGLDRAPGDPERRAYLQWIHYAETMAALVEELNLNHVFLRPPAKPSWAVVKLITARLRATLAGMETRLGDGWLLDSGLSGADIMMGFNLISVPYYVRLDPYPKVTAYRARMMTHPAFQRAQARDGEQDFYDRDFYEIPTG